MFDMNMYYFIYKDSIGNWNDTTSPIFIAKHKHCRAIPKKVLEKLGYDLIADFTYDLNNANESLIDKSVAEYIYN